MVCCLLPSWRSTIFLLGTLFILAAVAANGQNAVKYSEKAEKLFGEGVAQYEAERYAVAATSFDRVLREYPVCHRTTAAYIMKAKAQLSSGEAREAKNTLLTFQQAYPSSSYAPEAGYLTGLACLRLRQWEDALRSLLDVWRVDHADRNDTKLRLRILAALDTLIDTQLSVGRVAELRAGSQNDGESAFFSLKLAEKYLTAGDRKAAKGALDTITLRYRRNPYDERIAGLQRRLDQAALLKIAVLVPLMRRGGEASPAGEIGEAVLDGIRFAFEEFEQRNSGNVKVELDVRDTERDSALIVKLMSQFAGDGNVLCVLGPVFSNAAGIAARAAQAGGVPLVSPTANANGIAALGPRVFQANPDFENRGKAMARFAVVNQGLTRLAVLSPGEGNSKLMADAFAAEAKRRGAAVVVSETYERDVASLTKQLNNIRREALKEVVEPYLSFAGKVDKRVFERLVQLGVPQRVLDSLIQLKLTVSAVSLLGMTAKRKLDSLKIATLRDESKLKTLEVPVTGVQGIYMPIRGPEEIGVVSSQLAYVNIKTQILGSGEWNDASQLAANKSYCDGVIFESDHFVDPTNTTYAEFAARYDQQMKKRPSRYALYGYDAARVVLTQVSYGATTRESLAAALTNLTEFPGVRSRIGFRTRRVNPWLCILRYSADTIQRIAEINVDERAR